MCKTIMYLQTNNIPTKLNALSGNQQQQGRNHRVNNNNKNTNMKAARKVNFTVKHSLQQEQLRRRTNIIDNKQQQRTRSVRFCDNHNCTLMFTKATPQDKANAWYNSKEFMTMVKERRTVLRDFHRNDNQMPQGETSRGLESFLSAKICNEKKEKRNQFRKLILLEQDRQRMTGEYDPQSLHQLSYMCSQWERNIALSFAKHDALEAQQHQLSSLEDKSCSSSSSTSTTATSKELNQDVSPRPEINHNISLRLKLARSA